MQAGEKVHGNGEDDSGIFLDADFRQGLQIPELNADRFGGQEMSGVNQSLRRREFTLRVNDLGALLALGFGLLGHGSQHGLRHIDLLHLDVRHFYSPGRSVLIENTLEAQVDLLAMREQFIQFLFAEHGTQSCLRELRSLVNVIGNLHHRFIRVDDAQEDDGVHFERNVIARNDVLRRNFKGFLPQRYSNDAVDGSEHQHHAGAFRAR